MRLSELILCVVTAAPLAATAQPPRPPMFDAEQLSVLLDLDAYQKIEVQRILDAQRLNFEREALNFDVQRARRDEMRAQMLGELANVLTIEQLEKFKILSEPPDRVRRPLR